MSKPEPAPSRLKSLIDAMDRPLLGLAVITMGLYLLDLHGLLGGARVAYLSVSLLIDLIFVLDLVLKVRAFGIEYVQSPWFVIDLLSCLPVLDVSVNGVVHLRAIRFVRGFRILRFLRGLRVLRALRRIPAFDQFLKKAPTGESTQKFNRSMNVAMVSLTLAILVIIIAVRQRMEHKFLRRIDAEIHDHSDIAHLKALGGSLQPPVDSEYVTRTAQVGGRPRTVYFDLGQVDEQANEDEFILILGMMIMMLFFMYIMAYHQLDVSQTQLRALLNLALPKQVAEQLLIDPGAYNEKSKMPATIIFMDFVGFTRTCEGLARDPDQISAHLEAAMDRLVKELVAHDMIIDKFIGDAIMSFRGGPLTEGSAAEHAYRAVRSAVESTKALTALNDPYFHRVKIGGASAGDCMIGAFGTSARLSYTILGDGVNLAARLEPASGQCGTQNLFCEQTHDLCDSRADLVWRRWGKVRVAGKSAPVTVFEAFDAADLGDPTFLATFHRALEAFERADLAVAREDFRLADSQRQGGDEPSRNYLTRCVQLLTTGTPVGWEPVFETHK